LSSPPHPGEGGYLYIGARGSGSWPPYSCPKHTER
jgi:hypothetical protein